jgi:hypothetical protein
MKAEGKENEVRQAEDNGRARNSKKTGKEQTISCPISFTLLPENIVTPYLM